MHKFSLLTISPLTLSTDPGYLFETSQSFSKAGSEKKISEKDLGEKQMESCVSWLSNDKEFSFWSREISSFGGSCFTESLAICSLRV